MKFCSRDKEGRSKIIKYSERWKRLKARYAIVKGMQDYILLFISKILFYGLRELKTRLKNVHCCFVVREVIERLAKKSRTWISWKRHNRQSYFTLSFVGLFYSVLKGLERSKKNKIIIGSYLMRKLSFWKWRAELLTTFCVTKKIFSKFKVFLLFSDFLNWTALKEFIILKWNLLYQNFH